LGSIGRLSACVYFASVRRFIHANGMRIRLWNVGASSLHKIDSKAPHRLRYLTHPTPLNCATNDALPRPSAASSESFITKKVADQNVFWYRNDISASVASVVNPPATSAPSDGSNLTHDGGNFGGSSGAINRPVSTRNSSLTQRRWPPKAFRIRIP
jgi:hypothetical protein